MYTITKEYKDIPFAHRQPLHDGHCKLIHGHNWGIKIFVQSDMLDENGFVYDFGKMKMFKEWIADNLDHAIVLNENDKFREVVIKYPEYFMVYTPKYGDASAEGLAKEIFFVWNGLLEGSHYNKVNARIVRVDVLEDSKNVAIFQA